MSDDEELKE